MKRGPRKSKKKVIDWRNQASHQAEVIEPRAESLPSEVRFPGGPMFRAKRMALGLHVSELVPGREQVRLLKMEDGISGEPWDRHWQILNARFRSQVFAWMGSGQDWRELRLFPWSAAEIYAEVRRWREEGSGLGIPDRTVEP